jgi:hypothetical protein
MPFMPRSKKLLIRPSLPHTQLLRASREKAAQNRRETMTRKKKIMFPTWLEPSCGFRIGPDGEIEVMSPAETEAVVERAIRDAMRRGLAASRTLH